MNLMMRGEGHTCRTDRANGTGLCGLTVTVYVTSLENEPHVCVRVPLSANSTIVLLYGLSLIRVNDLRTGSTLPFSNERV